jgi:tRNA G18 (ribose-2'-O)-methylase SpoU
MPEVHLAVPVVEVTGTGDPRLADYRNVPDPDLLRSRGLFIAEGRHVVRRLLASPRFRTRSLLLTPAALAGLAGVPLAPDLPVFVVSQEAMNAVTGFNMHRGCLAAGERPAPVPWEAAAAGARLVVVLERVANADNVGSIFRNAAAFGAGAVLLGPACADPLYRKAIRTSMGAALQVPFAWMEDWPGDLARLKASGFGLWALSPDRQAVPLRDAVAQHRLVAQPVSAADRIALLAGHEGEGLSDGALAAADVLVRIPMARGVDSLNVATAAAIALYAITAST